ncbi:MAG: O-antigen ligase family protein [Gallionella sp.]|nr:O-antigen ligase family protein [Gallionella sp.]
MNFSVAGNNASEGDLAKLWALFALIVYAPLPLASNRPWALALLGLMAGGLLLWTVWCSGLQLWHRARVPLILLLLWMGLLAMQLVPLPGAFLHLLDQRAASGFSLADAGRGTISIDPYSTRLYLAKAMILSAVFWLVVMLVNSRRRIEWLAAVIVFSGLLQAVIGVVLMATGTTFQIFFVTMDNPRAHGTFVSPNNFAGYLELTLAVGIGLMIAKLDGRASVSWRQRLHAWLAVLLSFKAMLRLALIIMVIGLVASRSRMGNPAFFVSLLLTGLFVVIFSKHAARTTVYFIISLIVLDVVIIGGMVGVEKVVQRIESTNIETQVRPVAPVGVQAVPVVPVAGGLLLQRLSPEESVEERSEAGLASVQIVRHFPWLGTGGGTFHLVFPHYKPVRLAFGFWDHPHNDFVEFASEVGLSGMLLLVVMVIHSLLKSAMQVVQSRDRLVLGMAFASLMGVVSLLIHASVDFNFQNPANAMLFLILLSLPYLKNSSK